MRANTKNISCEIFFAAAYAGINHIYLEYVVVQEHHDDARYIKGGQARIDDEVAVVEQAGVWYAIRCVVQAEHYRRPDSHRYHPHENDGQPDATIVLVLGVFYWLCHSNIPATIIHNVKHCN